MERKSAVQRISPMLAVADMSETLAFYKALLGFRTTLETAEYSMVKRDGQTIHFILAASEEVLCSGSYGDLCGGFRD
jgi:catechol 2,3-dioxygenase-like lactoylglutathione lyase family enzyme